MEWSLEELILLVQHSNQAIAELTGRSMDEVAERRLLRNIEINCWDKFDPECAA